MDGLPDSTGILTALVGGPIFHEIRSAAYGQMDVPFASYVYGLGGRDIFPDNIEQAFAALQKAAQSKKRSSTERRYLNLRKD